VEPERAVGGNAFIVVRGPDQEPAAFEAIVEDFESGVFTLRLVDREMVIGEEFPSNEPIAMDTHPVVQRRQEGRDPAWVDGALYAHGSRRSKPAIITDLSMNGASVETAAWDGSEEVRLAIPWRKQSITIDAFVVGTEPALRGSLLHTRFRPLEPRQRDYLEDVIDGLRTRFDAAQEYLATKHISPNHL
jgi:hypothetical protein